MLLEGKTALITGGARGIGRKICHLFAEQGANLAFNYAANDKAAEEVLQYAQSLGRECIAFKGSVSDPVSVKELFSKVKEVYGGLDILVNNAGIKKDGFLAMMSNENWNEVLSVNLTGTFLCCREAVKLMMRKKQGAIVNISSLTGVMGQPGQANYAASKGGVIGFSKAVAKEIAKNGIRVNVIAPGFVETEMLDDVPEAVLEANKAQVPLQRFGSDLDIANVSLFLASEMSGYVTGEVIGVNGGLYM